MCCLVLPSVIIFLSLVCVITVYCPCDGDDGEVMVRGTEGLLAVGLLCYVGLCCEMTVNLCCV